MEENLTVRHRLAACDLALPLEGYNANRAINVDHNKQLTGVGTIRADRKSPFPEHQASAGLRCGAD